MAIEVRVVCHKKKIKSLIRPLYKLLSFLLIPFLRFRELDQDFQLLSRQTISDNIAGNKKQPACLIFWDTSFSLPEPCNECPEKALDWWICISSCQLGTVCTWSVLNIYRAKRISNEQIFKASNQNQIKLAEESLHCFKTDVWVCVLVHLYRVININNKIINVDICSRAM